MRKFMDDAKLSTKLVSIALICASIIGVGTLIGTMGMKLINDRATQIYDQKMVAMDKVDLIAADVQQVRGDVYKFILNPTMRVGTAQAIDDNIAEIHKTFTALASVPVNPQERKMLDDLNAAWEKYHLLLNQAMALASSGKENTAINNLETGDTLNAYIAFNQLDEKIDSSLYEGVTAAQAASSQIFWVLGGIAVAGGVGGLLIVLVLGVFVSRSITTALDQTVEMIRAMGKGHLKQRLQLRRKDEIGVLANAMDKLADDLQRTLNENLVRIADGDLEIAVEYFDRDDEIAAAETRMISSLRALVDQVNMLNHAAAQGKLEVRGEPEKFQGGYRQVVQGVNHTLDIVVDKVFWYEQLLDAIPVGLSVTDMNMQWTFLNRPVEDLLGIRREEVVAKPCHTWKSGICQTENCGIHKLRQNQLQTTFQQKGKDFQIDSAYLVNRRGEKIGHVEVISEVTTSARRTEYMRVELERIINNMHQFAQGNLDWDLTLAAPDDYTRSMHGNYKQLNDSLGTVRDAVASLLTDVNMLSQAAVEGKLGVRADANKHGGDFRKIVQGMNATLDAVAAPINDTNHVLGSIAQGNLGVQIDGHYQGDFETLRKSIKTMAHNLREMAVQSQQSAGSVGAASSQILASSMQMATATREQASAVNQITSTVKQIKASAEQVTQCAQTVASQAKQAMQNADRGTAAVEETMASMNDIRAKVETIAQNILALSEQTQQVGAIIDTVTDIAGQSNILALNAAIEAAQAGEAGKGFRVVADEVRNLAEQSRQAAAQVKVILGDIQKATNRTVMATEQGTKGVNQGSETVTRTARTIQELAYAVEQSAQTAQEILAGVEQQTIGLDQIAIGMNEISQAAQQTASGAEQSQQAAQAMAQTSATLQRSVSRFTVEA